MPAWYFLRSLSKSTRLRISFSLLEGRTQGRWRSRGAEMWLSSRSDARSTSTHFVCLTQRKLINWSNLFLQVGDGNCILGFFVWLSRVYFWLYVCQMPMVIFPWQLHRIWIRGFAFFNQLNFGLLNLLQWLCNCVYLMLFNYFNPCYMVLVILCTTTYNTFDVFQVWVFKTCKGTGREIKKKQFIDSSEVWFSVVEAWDFCQLVFYYRLLLRHGCFYLFWKMKLEFMSNGVF